VVVSLVLVVIVWACVLTCGGAA